MARERATEGSCNSPYPDSDPDSTTIPPPIAPTATAWAVTKPLNMLCLCAPHTRTCGPSRALRPCLQIYPRLRACALLRAARISTHWGSSCTPALNGAR
jgi:hypothetical protein